MMFFFLLCCPYSTEMSRMRSVTKLSRFLRVSYLLSANLNSKFEAMLLKHGLSDVELNGYPVFKLKGMLIRLIFF